MNQSKKLTNMLANVLNIEVMLTHNCNFRCKYCYEKTCNYQKENISDEVIEKIFRYLEWYLTKNPNSEIRINFWGGEPSLQIDKLVKIVDRYIDDNRFSFIIFTNGYLIDPVIDISKKCNIIRPDKFYTQISYDFAGQDRRVFNGDHPTKNLVKESIKKIVSENLPFGIKSTILFEDLPKIDKFYDEFKILESELGVEFAFPLTVDTTANWDKSDEEFDEMMEQFKNSLKNVLIKSIKNNEKNFNWLTGTRLLCSAGKNYFCVDVDGRIYPCHSVIFLENKDDYNLGSISQLKSFDLNFDIFSESEKCKKCDTCLCFRCNAHMSIYSPFKQFSKKWVDFGRVEKFCRVQREISKISYAYKKIKTGVYNGRIN